MPLAFATTDLSDAHNNVLHLAPIFQDFGGVGRFYGRVKTLETFEDNSKLRQAVETKGDGQVLVVDGGGSLNCALFGGNLAQLAAQNNWAGVVIYGCVRDKQELAAAKIGIKALATHPKKSEKRDAGTYDVVLNFGGGKISPADWLYADEDGILIATSPLH